MPTAARTDGHSHCAQEPDEAIHNEAGIQIHKEDMRSRRVELTQMLVYLAIHRGAREVDDADPQIEIERSAEPPAVS
jgi:hypothetical protein